MLPTGLKENGGSLAHDVYTNVIYNFSLKIPPGWPVVPAQSNAPVNLPGVDPELMKQAQTDRILLVMTENAPLKKPFDRKSLQIVATHLVSAQTSSAHDFLVYKQKAAKESGSAVEYLNAPHEVTINKQKLWWNKLKMNAAGGPQVANQYVVKQGSYLLQFFLVSPDEDGLKSLQSTIESLDIKPMPGEPDEPAKRATPRRKTAKPVGSQPAQAPAKPTQ